jgi:hypothetical protein
MENFIRRQNIKRYAESLLIETNGVKRRMLLRLLAEEREKQRAAGELESEATSRDGGEAGIVGLR